MERRGTITVQRCQVSVQFDRWRRVFEVRSKAMTDNSHETERRDECDLV
jgi:hypothetical protein